MPEPPSSLAGEGRNDGPNVARSLSRSKRQACPNILVGSWLRHRRRANDLGNFLPLYCPPLGFGFNSPPRWGLPFEAEEGVAQRKDFPLANAPIFLEALVAHWALLTASVGLATFRNHLHALHSGEPAPKILVKAPVGLAQRDEDLGVREARAP